jgi:hypothetical protein
MIKVMRHIELHTIESEHDLVLAELAGLDVSDSEVCESCFADVGSLGVHDFKGFVYCLDEESEWITCLDCADAVL